MVTEGTLEMVGSGSQSRFFDLYEREAPVVLRYIRAATGGSPDAEDVCAETFCSAWDAWSRFSGDDSAARGWLFRIARNKVVDHARKGVRRRALPLPAETGSQGDMTDTVVLLDALARLDKGDRELLGLRVAGLSHGEIATIQGRSEDAVKMAWSRSLKRLRSQLEDS